jgi:aminoglycoside/choline kinase family phosphotransferase
MNTHKVPIPDTAGLAAMHEEHFSEDVTSIDAMKGDASDRRIFRLRSAGHSSIGILGPNIAENRAFTGFARGFRAAGLRVPEIYAIDDAHRGYLEEDLGDLTLALWQASLPEETRVEQMRVTYTSVLGELLRFQVDYADTVDYSLCYQYPDFGADAMAFDIRYFRENFLERLVVHEWDRAAFERETAGLIELLLRAERNGFLYRDFQSRNIMLRDGVPWFIDFQSGRRGAPHYDVAALLYDSRGNISEAERMLLVTRYCDLLEQRRPVRRDEFLFHFHGFAVLRLLQALGAFSNLGLNKGKPDFLALIPSRLQALSELLRAAEIMHALPELRSLLFAIADDPSTISIPYGTT